VCAVVVAAVVVVVSARGGGDNGITVTGSGLRVGAAPPVFSGTAVDGRRFDLATTRGQVVLVNFFATWCSNCREEEPLLERLSRQYAGRGLVVVGVDWNDSGDARGFVNELHVTYPALLDSRSRVGSAYGVTDLPESVWIGRDGRVAQVFHGQLSDEVVAAELASLLGRPA